MNRVKNPELRAELNLKYGKANWKYVKGFAKVELEDGNRYYAEIHFCEAYGKGKHHERIKHILNKI